LNGLCALLMLEAMDVDRQTALAALADFEPLAGRGAEALLQIAGGTATLIDESYNANPLSMTAALRTLGARPVTGRRIAVLTDMLELGPDGPAMHAALVDPLVEADVDQVFVAGPQMKSLWDALPATRRGGYALTAAELAPKVAEALSPGDVIMVKGSNGSRAGLIAAALLQRYRTGGEG
jgi:UDP-N-acetylmuramoyl-tripeptide--D-alanyl-D-alanine ligase